VSITAPNNGSSFAQGTSITFEGSADDSQDGHISSNIVWQSNLDDDLGTGASITRANLSVGTHTITASVTDSGNLEATAWITVTITQTPPPSGITLTVTTRRVRGDRFADLVWNGATSAVDVYRNNSIVVTTANDGAYTDQAPKGGNSFTYRVCNTGTSTCSNNVTVSF
jgi:hypothetical protein